MFRYLPEQASEVAPKVDWLNNLITDLSLFFTVAIVGTMLYFAWTRRRRNGVEHETPRIEGSHFLEFLWTAVPTAICIYVAAYGVSIYREIRVVPRDAISINTTARQWAWAFQYENGKKAASEVVVPVNKAVKFVLTSKDVLHSFFIPSMRVKSDAVPGQFTYVSFTPVKTGTYDIFCTEYCGKDHSAMMSKLKVVSEEEYARWLADDSDKIKYKPADAGKTIYNEQGCKSCHTLDGSKLVGPSFKGLYGRGGKLDDGSSYTADENYIKESILNPNARIVEGFAKPSAMPAFQGVLDDDQIGNLIAFVKTLDGSQPVDAPVKLNLPFKKDLSQMSPADRGKILYQEKACVGCHSLDGSKGVGPSYKGLYGKKGKFVDGAEYTADDEYLKTAILKANQNVVEGYVPGLMPQFEGVLTDAQVSDLVEYIKSIK